MGKETHDRDRYTTVVIRHPNESDARDYLGKVMDDYPLGDAVGSTRLGVGDYVSCIEAVEMALECDALDHSERIELAQELCGQRSWADCEAIFEKWELNAENGQLADLREATQ